MTAYDISEPQKPKSIQPIVKRMGQYVQAMGFAKKPVESIAMFADDYDAVMRSLTAHAKKHSLPDVTGLRYGAIPVKRSGIK